MFQLINVTIYIDDKQIYTTKANKLYNNSNELKQYKRKLIRIAKRRYKTQMIEIYLGFKEYV